MNRRKLASALAALLVMAAGGAQALPNTPYDPSLLLWYPLLTESQQGVFDTVYAAVRAGQTDIDLPQGTAYADASAAVNALLMDCPELVMLENRFTLRYYQAKPEEATQVVLTRSSEASAEDTAALAGRLAAGVSTDWDGALALHDLVCALTDYREGANAHNALGVLSDGAAVCEGYAEAYTLLCRMAGIRCGMVTGVAVDADGVSQTHAWNQVILSEGAMLADTTWDDHEDSELGLVHWYFGLTDEQLWQDHQPDAALPLRLPCDTLSLNWHVRTGAYAAEGQTEESLKARWFSLLDSVRDGGTAELRLADEADFARLQANAEAWTDAYNTERGAEGFYGSYRVYMEARQNIYRIVK